MRIFSPRPLGPEISNRLIYRVKATPEVQDAWERRVIDLCDGRPLSALIKALYSEELSRGGWIVDIGLWKNHFDRQVVMTINKLAEQGYVYVKADEAVPAQDGTERLS